MKTWLPCMLLLLPATIVAQSLQLHYDLRHTIDPAHNARNFPVLYFEYFKSQDSGHALIKPGSFLFKMEADLQETKSNPGKCFMQVAQTFRIWPGRIYAHLSYSGGLGLTEPRQYSYYITNTFLTGIAYPFQWKGGYWSAVADCKYVPYTKPSVDFLFTLYFYKGLFHYKAELSGDFSCWTENRNHGEGETGRGKRFFFFAEPQLWVKTGRNVFVGSKINGYYHVNATENTLQVYPTLAVRCKW